MWTCVSECVCACMCVQASSVDVGSVDASQSAKLPLSAVTPVPYVSDGHSTLKVRLSDSFNKLGLGNS